jgi:hypothetical protein
MSDCQIGFYKRLKMAGLKLIIAESHRLDRRFQEALERIVEPQKEYPRRERKKSNSII